MRSAYKHNVLTKVEGMKLKEITEGAKYGVLGEGAPPPPPPPPPLLLPLPCVILRIIDNRPSLSRF
jgi:hypothetical protein